MLSLTESEVNHWSVPVSVLIGGFGIWLAAVGSKFRVLNGSIMGGITVGYISFLLVNSVLYSINPKLKITLEILLFAVSGGIVFYLLYKYKTVAFFFIGLSSGIPLSSILNIVLLHRFHLQYLELIFYGVLGLLFGILTRFSHRLFTTICLCASASYFVTASIGCHFGKFYTPDPFGLTEIHPDFVTYLWYVLWLVLSAVFFVYQWKCFSKESYNNQRSNTTSTTTSTSTTSAEESKESIQPNLSTAIPVLDGSSTTVNDMSRSTHVMKNARNWERNVYEQTTVDYFSPVFVPPKQHVTPKYIANALSTSSITVTGHSSDSRSASSSYTEVQSGVKGMRVFKWRLQDPLGNRLSTSSSAQTSTQSDYSSRDLSRQWSHNDFGTLNSNIKNNVFNTHSVSPSVNDSGSESIHSMSFQ